ncbi:MAG: glycosyltransferase family A protein [Leucobacter sp.]
MSTHVEDSAVGAWLRSIVHGDADPRLQESAGQMLSVLEDSVPATSDGPFLTVVMRTQGRKPEAFRDALLTLLGQSDQDFELLVVGHDVDDAVSERILAVLDEQPSSFRSRIRYIPVRGGGRSRPLNAAIEVGAGRYFAFFDDDDMVFGHWVETFREAAEGRHGRLIRAVASTQRMEQETWSSEVQGFRTLTWPRAEYAASFEYEQHLERNHTPFMSIAFPCQLFTLWGERFDEELDVCEDWDMILRGAFLLGVESVDELTSIYRLWTGVTSSYTEHDRASWRMSESRVRAKLNGRSVILPSGGPASIIESMRQVEVRVSNNTQLNQILGSTSWRVTAPLRWVSTVLRALARRVRGRG